jgi:FkbM family methyltransferase
MIDVSGMIKNSKISKEFIKHFLPINPIIIDAGAHIGVDTIEMSKIWRKGQIYAFEPVPTLFAELVKNTTYIKRVQYFHSFFENMSNLVIRKDKRFLRLVLSSLKGIFINRSYLRNIECYNLALAERSGIAEMFISSGVSDGSSSLLEPTGHIVDHPDTYFRDTISVKTTTIDAWADSRHIASIDMLWLDLQGCELSVLKSSPNVLKTIKIIHTEVSVRQQYEGAPLYGEIREWLQAKGFSVIMEAIPPSWDGGNVLFIRDKKVNDV